MNMLLEVLLAVAVVTIFLSCAGLLLFRDFFERLHFLAPASTVAAFAVLLAVAMSEGWGQATAKSGLTFLLLLLNSSVLAHATARAARIRGLGSWGPQPGEAIVTSKPGHGREEH